MTRDQLISALKWIACAEGRLTGKTWENLSHRDQVKVAEALGSLKSAERLLEEVLEGRQGGLVADFLVRFPTR